MNSLVDWEEGYDRNDRNKQHHPLNEGSLSVVKARVVVIGSTMFTVAYGVGLALPRQLPVFVLALGAVSGIVYNKLGKRTLLKPFFISVAHTTVFVVPYLSLGGKPSDITFLLSTLFVLLWVFYQIAISGEVKDIMQMDEENILRVLGTRINMMEDKVYFSYVVTVSSLLIKALTVGVGLFILLSLTEDLLVLSFPVFIFLSVVMVNYSLMLTLGGSYRRGTRIRWMATVEMCTLFIFIIVLQPVIGYVGTITLMVLSSVWVAVFNKLEWGTVLQPDV